MTEIDLDFVRGQFPAFQETTLRDHAFFESAGGSYTCRHVIWRLHRFYKERKVQPFAPYAAAQAGGAEMDEARARLARIMGIEGDELSFGSSTSANIYALAHAFAEVLQPGDVVIVTNQDHEAHAAPWRRLADHGIEVREWRMDPATGHLDTDDLRALLDDKVRLVCFPHASSIVGEVNPVAEIAAMAHRVGAHVCVDGASYAAHGLPNVDRLGADIYLFSAYKAFGPHQGIMVVRRGLAQALPPQGQGGGAGNHDQRLVPGGLDHAQVASVAGMVDYIDALYARHFRAGRDAMGRAGVVHDLIRAQEARLMEPLLDALAPRANLRLIGPARAVGRISSLAMALDRPGVEVAAELAGFGILCAGGAFRCDQVLRGLGIDPAHGVLRLSLLHYTSRADVGRLIEALDRVL